MDQTAIKAAQVALDRATQALADMRAAPDFTKYETTWSDFLTAANRVYTRLEQGSKTNSKSRAWFGQKVNERRKDSLLRYIHHARNADEHVLAEITQREPAFHEFASGPGSWQLDGVWSSTGGKMTVTALGGQIPGKSVPYRFSPAKVKMLRVTDRGDHYYPPPSHKGKPLTDPSPADVAELALEHLRRLIEDACKLAT